MEHVSDKHILQHSLPVGIVKGGLVDFQVQLESDCELSGSSQ